MTLKLEDKEYSKEQLEALVKAESERLAEEKFARHGVGRKGEFDISGGPGVAGMEDSGLPEELQIKSDHIYIASKLLKCDPRSLKMWERFDNLRKKAMDTATASEGAEWIPTGFSPRMLETIRLKLKVAALHERIPMPTNPFKLPIEGGDATIYLQAEQTSDTPTKVTASTTGTDNITFDAVKLMARVIASVELEEDSVIGVVGYIRNKLIKGLAEAIEDTTLNGDTSTTHQDSDTHALGATAHQKGWKGYRKYALAAALATVDLSTFNIANLRAIRTAMGKYGTNPADLAWVVGVKGYDKMLSLDEVKTVDKYGDKATILQGELAKLDGSPVIVSEKVRENLNASGVHDGVTETKTVVHLVYRPGFLFGDRRSVKIQVLREIYAESDQIGVVASQRLDFQPVYDTTTETIIGLGYNIA